MHVMMGGWVVCTFHFTTTVHKNVCALLVCYACLHSFEFHNEVCKINAIALTVLSCVYPS